MKSPDIKYKCSSLLIRVINPSCRSTTLCEERSYYYLSTRLNIISKSETNNNCPSQTETTIQKLQRQLSWSSHCSGLYRPRGAICLGWPEHALVNCWATFDYLVPIQVSLYKGRPQNWVIFTNTSVELSQPLNYLTNLVLRRSVWGWVMGQK